MTAAAFDSIAPVYDQLWTDTAIGQLQRQAVWRHIAPLFQPGDSMLDLGCGTGEDAVILGGRGVHVIATDASPEMVMRARLRGVDARLLPIERIGDLAGLFDAALSNFGALNCVTDLARLRDPLARLICPGGCLAICMISRFCLWETVWYASRARFRKAARRWRGKASSSLNVTVFYPRVGDLTKALSPDFRLIETAGIGICVPPSYVRGLSSSLLATLARIDRRIDRWPLLRALSDHRLLVFQRV